METGMTKCLTDKIGFLSKEDLLQYQKMLEVGDVVSKYSRMLDSTSGALTLAFLAITEPNGQNDMLAECYRFSLKECRNLIETMHKELNELLTKEIEK